MHESSKKFDRRNFIKNELYVEVHWCWNMNEAEKAEKLNIYEIMSFLPDLPILLASAEWINVYLRLI